MEELRLTHGIDTECRHKAEENQRRVEKERKDMEERLAKVVEDWSWAEKLLSKRGQTSSLRNCVFFRVFEKKRSKEVTRLRVQFLVQQQWLLTITCFKLFQTATFRES